MVSSFKYYRLLYLCGFWPTIKATSRSFWRSRRLKQKMVCFFFLRLKLNKLTNDKNTKRLLLCFIPKSLIISTSRSREHFYSKSLQSRFSSIFVIGPFSGFYRLKRKKAFDFIQYILIKSNKWGREKIQNALYKKMKKMQWQKKWKECTSTKLPQLMTRKNTNLLSLNFFFLQKQKKKQNICVLFCKNKTFVSFFVKTKKKQIFFCY